MASLLSSVIGIRKNPLASYEIYINALLRTLDKK